MSASPVSPVTREYLETIYNLAVEGDPIVGARLAEKFRVTESNVAQMLKRMERDGLIVMPGRGRGRAGEGIELTDAGREQAEALLRQHRLAERFLTDVLGMSWVEAHEEAHHMERGMSPAIEEHLMQALGNPRTCPHGNPIPTKTMDTLGYLRQQHALRLSAAEEGAMMKVVLISEVVEDESALLTYLGQIDIMPGARVTVLERLPQDHTLKVSVVPRGDTPGQHLTSEETAARAHTVSLDQNLAAKIWVRK